jgi:hypothetical protein
MRTGRIRAWRVWTVGVAILGVPIAATGTDSLRRFQTEAFSETADLGVLSDAVKVRLAQFAGGRIANSDEPFQETDLITSSNGDLPLRRLILAGTAEDLTFVEYQHGGEASHQHFVLFRTIGSGSTLIKACWGQLPIEIEKLKKVVGTSACRWRSKEHLTAHSRALQRTAHAPAAERDIGRTGVDAVTLSGRTAMFGLSNKARVVRSVPVIHTSREKLWDSSFAVVEGGRKFVVPKDPCDRHKKGQSHREMEVSRGSGPSASRSL